MQGVSGLACRYGEVTQHRFYPRDEGVNARSLGRKCPFMDMAAACPRAASTRCMEIVD